MQVLYSKECKIPTYALNRNEGLVESFGSFVGEAISRVLFEFPGMSLLLLTDMEQF